jgi:hypothetical protein
LASAQKIHSDRPHYFYENRQLMYNFGNQCSHHMKENEKRKKRKIKKWKMEHRNENKNCRMEHEICLIVIIRNHYYRDHFSRRQLIYKEMEIEIIFRTMVERVDNFSILKA